MSNRKRSIKKAHQFDHRFISWMVCTKCGLVALNNKPSRKEMGKPCHGAEKEDVDGRISVG